MPGRARIDFEASEFGPARSTSATPEARLLDVCDACDAPVPFSCRDANCGTCLIEVVHGADLLGSAQADERLVLDALGQPLDGSFRLACQAVVAQPGYLCLRTPRLSKPGGSPT